MKTPLKNYRCPDKFGEWLGYRVVKVNRQKREAEVTITLREDHLSPAGKIHGGVVSGFFDFACGVAVFSTMGDEDFCSTVELKVNYFRPLDVGNQLNCQARVMYRGNRLAVVHAQLFRKGEAEPVAMATATFYVVTRSR
ncbi:MAG: PaaI family thioesterase [Deltaproteobacteria bacterium]|nr:PaaI family thioesterase [Deltaproteobacteria bacterium]